MDTDVRSIPKQFLPLVAAKPGAGAKLQPLDLSQTPTATLGPLNLDRHPTGVMPGGSLRALEAPARVNQHDALRKEAETLVAGTFFGTLLKQMRNSPFRSDLFDGGRGGQAFGSMYDQQLAERMARGAGSKLVDGIVRRLEARKAYAKSDLRRTRPDARGARDPGTGLDAAKRDAAASESLLSQPRSHATAA